MLILFTAVAISIVFSIFATQNTDLVVLHFLDFSTPSIPVYLSILIPVFIAIVVSAVAQISMRISSKILISHQRKLINGLKRELAEVTKDLHKVELENAKFKTELGEPKDSNSI